MSINCVTISGNLTRDPELRATGTGTPVLQFGMAVNDRRKNVKTGEWEDYPNFIECTMFGARAEGVSRFLGKGAKVCVFGKLRWSQWEKDGKKNSKVSVIVEEIEFMSQANRQQQADQPVEQPVAQPEEQPAMKTMAKPVQHPAQAYQPYPAANVYDEDIPF